MDFSSTGALDKYLRRNPGCTLEELMSEMGRVVLSEADSLNFRLIDL